MLSGLNQRPVSYFAREFPLPLGEAPGDSPEKSPSLSPGDGLTHLTGQAITAHSASTAIDRDQVMSQLSGA